MGPLRLRFNRLLVPIALSALVVAIVESWLTFPWLVSAPDDADRFGVLAASFWITASLQGAGLGFAIGIRFGSRWLGAVIGLVVGAFIDVAMLFVTFMLHHGLVIITDLPN